MSQSNSFKFVLAVLCAVITLREGNLDQASSVYASEKTPGGAYLASSEDQTPAGTASGTVSLNGVKINVHYAYAFAQPNTFDEKKLDIAVLLTEKPVSEDDLKDVARLEYVAQKRHNYALFKINDQGKPIYEVIEHPVLKNTRLMMSGFTVAQFVSKVFSRECVAGSFITGGKADFSGYEYEMSVNFTAQIQQAKLPEPLPDDASGKALPPGGGDPVKAYRAYRKAIEKKDIAAIRKLLQMPAGVAVTDDNIRDSLDFMASSSPKNPKITKDYVSNAGDRAVVYVSGTREGEKLYGTIGLARKDGLWMVTEEKWSDMPPTK